MDYKFPTLSDEERKQKLDIPAGKIHLIIDTDAKNEVDDQFAVSWALRSPDRFIVDAVYAAPFSHACFSKVASYLSDLAEDNAALGFAIVADLMEKDGKGNILFSPLSLYEDTALLTFGAAGDTRTEIEENILYADADSAAEAINSFNAKLPESVHIANSLWYNENHAEDGRMDDAYVEKAKQLFNAEIEELPYDDAAVQKINNWVSENTAGMIKEIIKSLDPDEILHLINALSFESEWEVPYMDSDIVEDTLFTNADGKEETVTLLFSRDERYHEIENSKGELAADLFVRPYKDGKTAFVGILPVEGTSTEEVIDLLKQEDVFTDAVTQAYYYDADLTAAIPEYTFDYTIPLNEILKQEGMQKAFTDDADFSPMFGGLPVYVSSVLQKTHIEVDRKGTKAAAVTDIALAETALAMDELLPKYIILDRPFVYAIVDMESGLPYFIGIQNTI